MNALWRAEAKSNHALSIRWSPAALPTRRVLDVALPPTLEATLDTRGHTRPAPPPRQLNPHAARPAHDGYRWPARNVDRCIAPRCLRYGRHCTHTVIPRDGCLCSWRQEVLPDRQAIQTIRPGCDAWRQRPETIRLMLARRLDFHGGLPHTSTRTTSHRPLPA